MKENDRWVVYEAYRNVEVTPLKEFLFRGRNHGFAVYRLKSSEQKFIPGTVKNVKSYLGRPYDARYRWDDERIYCTELIYKAFETETGRPLGKLVRLGDLNWRPFVSTIEHFEGGPPPWIGKSLPPSTWHNRSRLNSHIASISQLRNSAGELNSGYESPVFVLDFFRVTKNKTRKKRDKNDIRVVGI